MHARAALLHGPTHGPLGSPVCDWQGYTFFTYPGCMLDAVIVVASLYADLRLGKQFVVTLRMWRLVRIAHGVFEAMETRLHELVRTSALLGSVIHHARPPAPCSRGGR